MGGGHAPRLYSDGSPSSDAAWCCGAKVPDQDGTRRLVDQKLYWLILKNNLDFCGKYAIIMVIFIFLGLYVD